MQAKTEPAAFAPEDGDVWHDEVPAFTGGQFWHARLDERGQVELFELGGPGLVPAADVGKMRGGLMLVRNRAKEFRDALGWAGAPWGAIVDGYQKIDTTWRRIDRPEDIDLDALRQSHPAFSHVRMVDAVRIWRESIGDLEREAR